MTQGQDYLALNGPWHAWVPTFSLYFCGCSPVRATQVRASQQTSGGRQPDSIALGMDENQIYCQSKEFSWLNFSTLTFSFFPIKDLNNSIEDEDVYDEIFDQCCTPDGLAVKCHPASRLHWSHSTRRFLHGEASKIFNSSESWSFLDVTM